ncbi:nucleotidyl transferase AbiEii/AbiGii toxin family protein [Caballeronia mineralivorans]|uniref:nucleotidyl transferase AbiEii/AbiGii toxin family protein n=1 Tax=Caballeronia mineralivorans TaxID=2010198 RepID=UPI003898E1EC
MKLLLPEGEIDFVVSPNLTDPGYDQWTLLDRAVRAETAAEIVVKKMWHRGDRATARDLFDLSLVIERDPAALLVAGEVRVERSGQRERVQVAPGRTKYRTSAERSNGKGLSES